MQFTIKYKFNEEDRNTMIDRCLLLGEACAFLEDLGLVEELGLRHKNICEKAAEVLNR